MMACRTTDKRQITPTMAIMYGVCAQGKYQPILMKFYMQVPFIETTPKKKVGVIQQYFVI